MFPSILDGTFRIRVKQDTGDHDVAGGSAPIDAVLDVRWDVPGAACAGAGRSATEA